ncbi:MAG: hypothetical protein KBA23_14800 [Amaricoccus sp.]|nr:hypothetical protein [Amaricoccus sp.]
MRRPILFAAAGVAAIAAVAATAFWLERGPDPAMSFFVTSANPGRGGDLGGLPGADAWCATLAETAGVPVKRWAAYLSTSAVDARDRIGIGPWVNATGEAIAADVAALHAAGNHVARRTALDETGGRINARGEAPPLRHDILTGSLPDGTRSPLTCSDWTSDDAGAAMVGHHDGADLDDKPSEKSWNSAHPSKGCSAAALREGGGDGLFYCFAVK